MKQIDCQSNQASRPTVFLILLRTFCWIASICAASLQAAPTLELQTASGGPGSTVLLPLIVRGGSNVVAAQADIVYASANLTAQAALLADNLAGFTITSYAARPGILRLVLYSRTGSTLPDPVQLSVPFAISANSPSALTPVSLTNVILADASARAVGPPTLVAGAISISRDSGPRFQSVLLSPDGVLQLQLIGTAGKSYVLQTSADLRVWSALTTKVAVGGSVNFSDNVKPGQLFYRTAVGP